MEDEILAVNLVDVRHVSLDDVVIIMSIPRRLVLTIRSRISGRMNAAMAARPAMDEVRPPVVVVKKEFVEEPNDEYPGPGDWMRGTPGRTQVMLEPHHQTLNQRPQPDVSNTFLKIHQLISLTMFFFLCDFIYYFALVKLYVSYGSDCSK